MTFGIVVKRLGLERVVVCGECHGELRSAAIGRFYCPRHGLVDVGDGSPGVQGDASPWGSRPEASRSS